jgi:hypothetical protein
VYQQFHVFWFEHLTDQRALGMSMRVERASLEQVKYPSLSVDPSSCNYLKSLLCHTHRLLVISLVYRRKLNMKTFGLCKPSGQMLLWFTFHIFLCLTFVSACRFKNGLSHSRRGRIQGRSVNKVIHCYHIGCHFSCLFIEQLSTDLSIRLLFENLNHLLCLFFRLGRENIQTTARGGGEEASEERKEERKEGKCNRQSVSNINLI